MNDVIPQNGQTDSGKTKLYVLDDEQNIRDSLKRYFAIHDWIEAICTDDPQEVLDAVKGGKADAILVDIMMPKISGLDVVPLFRMHRRFMPIIVMTGCDLNPKIEIDALKAGANYFLRKPFNLGDIPDILDALLLQAPDELEVLQSVSNEDKLDLLGFILGGTDDMVYVEDVNDCIIMVNPVCRAIFPGVQFTGKHASDIFPENCAVTLKQMNEKLKTSSDNVINNIELVVDGRIMFFSVKKFPLTRPDGKMWATCTMARDITELRDNEMFCSISQEATEMGSWEWNIVSGELRLSPQMEIILGYKPGEFELTFKNYYRHIHEDDRQRYDDEVKQLLKDQSIAEIEHRIRRPDGEIRWVVSKGSIIRDSMGDPLKGIGITQDITDNRLIASEHLLYSEALRTSANAMVITNTEGQVLFANDAFCSIYGYSQDELKGKSTSVLNPGVEYYTDMGFSRFQYEKLFTSMWNSVLDPDIGYWSGDLYNKCKDGHIIQVHLIISSIKNSDNKVTGFSAMPIDVSKQREDEQVIRVECYRALADLAETRDNETGEHMKRIAFYCKRIAEQMGMSTKFCKDIEMFAPLHDIGKVGIADSILLAPRKLTTEEFMIMKHHSTIGYEILKDRPTLEMAAEISRYHHERWNGTGYPRGLAGHDIPLSARIMAVGDVYDALVSERPYKKAWSHEKAIALIKEERGEHFDPDVADAFLALEKDFEKLCKDG